MNLKICAVTLFTFCSISFRVGSAQGDYRCVHNQQDFTDNGWLDDAGDLNWAADSSELPGEFKDNLKGQYQDVFYFGYPSSTANPYIRNPMSQWGSAGPAYVYLKYYTHNKSITSDYYILPEIFNFYYDLIPCPAYTWKEVLLEIYPGEEVELGATTLENGNYLFVDTIIYTYGIPYDVSKDMEVVKALCPQEVGTTSTTVSLTDSSTSSPSTLLPSTSTTAISSTTLVSYSTSDSTSTEPTSTVWTTTKPPTTPYFRCIDTQMDFENNYWLAYPYYNYAYNSSLLPQPLPGLEGQGLFFMGGSNDFKNNFFFKNFSDEPGWEVVPTYLYLKYYAHTVSNNNQTVYVRPAHVTDEQHVAVLPPGKDFVWEQDIMQIDGSADKHLIEIGIQNFQAREFFLIEKIAVVRSSDYVEVLGFVQSCAKQ